MATVAEDASAYRSETEMLENALPASRTVALLTSFCLLVTSLIPSVAAALCPCPGMSGNPKPLAFGLVTEKTPSKEEIETFTALKNIKTGAASISLGSLEYKIGTTNNCESKTIAEGVTCKVGVIFTPPGLETYDGALSLVYEIEASKCTETEKISLEGAGKP